MLELSHIELFAERARDHSNPIWSLEGRREMVAVAETASVSLASLCMNETLVTPFDDPALAADLATRLPQVMSDLHVDMVVLPCWRQAIWASSTGRARPGPSACLPTTSMAAGPDSRLNSVSPRPRACTWRSPCPRWWGCVTTAGRDALGFDAATELRMLGQRVSHIHAKDKNAAGENVRFGTGTVDFGSVLTAMAECMFEGLVTMESTRGDDPIATAAEHRAFLLSIGGHEH